METAESHLDILDAYLRADHKTDAGHYVSTVGITDPEKAAEQITQTHEIWEKMRGKKIPRIAYHLIQSFSPEDNITPELAHQLGRELLFRIAPGHEAVIGTHLDKEHIHNHIVFCSVRAEDGKAFHMPKGYTRNVLLKISNELCAQHGLCEAPLRRVSRSELSKQRQQQASMKERIAQDLRIASSAAQSTAQILLALEDMGYETDGSAVHIRIRPPGEKRFWRLDTFLKDKDNESDRTAGYSVVSSFRGRLRGTKGKTLRRRHILTRFEYIYLSYLRTLGCVRISAKRNGTVSPASLEKANEALQELRYVCAHQVVDPAAEKAAAEHRYKELNREKFELRGRKNKLAPLFAAERCVRRFSPLAGSLSNEHEKELLESQKILEASSWTPEQIRYERKELEDKISLNRTARKETQHEIQILEKIGSRKLDSYTPAPNKERTIQIPIRSEKENILVVAQKSKRRSVPER